MQKSLEITFEGLAPSPAIEKSVREHVEKLEKFSTQIVFCRVVVFLPHHRHHKGNLYGIKIFLGLPRGQMVSVARRPDEHFAHEDVYVAIRDAFKAARRQLQDQIRKMEGRVKTLRKPSSRRTPS